MQAAAEYLLPNFMKRKRDSDSAQKPHGAENIVPNTSSRSQAQPGNTGLHNTSKDVSAQVGV